MNKSIRWRSLFINSLTIVGLSTAALLSSCQSTSSSDENTEESTAYIFSSFRGNGNDGLHLSYSHDGLNWTVVNQDNSVLTPKVGGKLMRDPCVILGPDNRYHMVWTSSWEDGGIGVAHSDDLINWSEQVFVPVMADYPTAKNSWAPEIFWDDATKQYVIYWASTIPGRYPHTEKHADKGWDHRIYATTTKDFINYSPTQLFFEPGFNVIDSTIYKIKDEYLMVLKEETRYPPAKNLRVARSASIFGPWQVDEKAFTPQGLWVEGPTISPVGDWYYVYYDEYTQHQYGVMRTQDFNVWENISSELSMPKGARHGTILPVSSSQLATMLEAAKAKQ